eukprot:TRINITY_DN261_c0_g2_i1.p1 TRINITY_DN261_c0_g2~~TRINITY_DN261_c0_g2_i1.p1  ORF type:complete len:346 (+),score=168.54 TRINITY_DN261_c0_g2_i1:331-1368(+)
MFTPLNGEYKTFAVTNSSATISVTSRLTKYPAPKQSKFSIWDTFGWGEDNYSAHEVSMLIQGMLKEGYKEGTQIGPDVLLNNPTFNDHVHGIAIAFPAVSTTNKNAIQKMRDIYENLVRQSIQCVFLFTRLTEIDDTLDKHPERVFESQSLQNYVNQFIKSTGVSPDNIFFMLGHTAKPSTYDSLGTYVKNYLALKALDTLLYTQVSPFIQTKGPKATAKKPEPAPAPAPTPAPTPSSPKVESGPETPKKSTGSDVNANVNVTPSKKYFKVRQTGDSNIIKMYVPAELSMDMFKKLVAQEMNIDASSIYKIYERDTDGDLMEIRTDSTFQRLDSGTTLEYSVYTS